VPTRSQIYIVVVTTAKSPKYRTAVLKITGTPLQVPEKWTGALQGVRLPPLNSAKGVIGACAALVELARAQEPTTLGELAELEKILSFERLLSAAVDEPGPHDLDLANPSAEFFADLSKRINDMQWTVELERTKSGALLHPQASVRTWDDLYVLLAITLMDEHKRNLIGQCRFPPCSRFFVIERGQGGRPRDSYCTPEHRRADTTPRKRRQRAADVLREKTRYSTEAVTGAVLAAARNHPGVAEAEQLAALAESILLRKGGTPTHRRDFSGAPDTDRADERSAEHPWDFSRRRERVTSSLLSTITSKIDPRRR
jgi:hypothetical protein